MKLEKILENLNSLEKNSFLKIIDNIKSSNPKNNEEIDKILSNINYDLKNADSISIAKVFDLVSDEFAETIKAEFLNISSQLDIFIDILIRDGNNIMRQDWLNVLYERELNKIDIRTKEVRTILNSEKSDIDDSRKRDYKTYKACIDVAYKNDIDNNRDPRITDDEQSILNVLTQELELSQEEIKLLGYMVIPPMKLQIDDAINLLKNTGVLFYSRKNNLVYVADEVVRVLRRVRKKEIADKYYRRVLKALREPQINNVCRKHGINIRGIDYEEKVKEIIKGGISFTSFLKNGVHREGTNLTEKKKFLNELWTKNLKIDSHLKGVTVEDKINTIINYFDKLEKDERVGISVDGYDKLLVDLEETIPQYKHLLFKVFELPQDTILDSEHLLDFNIKPRDILDLLPVEALKTFIEEHNLKSRGDLVINILDEYRDVENLLIENYTLLGFRDINGLKNNGITIKESEIGIKFEDVTRSIFENLGFDVDEKLRKEINTAKNQIDLVLNLGNNDLIIIECKTVKERGYNKFSTVSRQIKSYVDRATDIGYNVMKSLLIAPEFSDDFINECDLQFEINLSLITASSLVNILEGFKDSKFKQFPYQLLMKDVLIKEDRILKAIKQ